MKDDRRIGILMESSQDFYYLEVGENYYPNPIPKLISTLTQRGVLSFNKDNPRDAQARYSVISYERATKDKLNIISVYLSDNIRKSLEKEPVVESTWGAPTKEEPPEESAPEGKTRKKK